MHSNGCISLLQAESQISAWSSLIASHVAKREKKKKGKSKGSKGFKRTAERKGSCWGKYIGLVGKSHPYQQLDTHKRWADAKWKEWVPWAWLPWSLCSKKGAVVWICDHSNADNTQVLWLLSFSTLSPAANWPRMGTKAGGGTAEQLTQTGYIPCPAQQGKLREGHFGECSQCHWLQTGSTSVHLWEWWMIVFASLLGFPLLRSFSVSLKLWDFLWLFLISSLYYWLGKRASSCGT